MDIKTQPILYILLRTDMESMNSGKGAAQASHAATAFARYSNLVEDTSQLTLINIWEDETSQGFGTVIVLSVNETQLHTSINIAQEVGLVSEVIYDPTYPLRDGKICHFIPIDTCGYIFGDKKDLMLKAIVGNFSLHP